MTTQTTVRLPDDAMTLKNAAERLLPELWANCRRLEEKYDNVRSGPFDPFHYSIVNHNDYRSPRQIVLSGIQSSLSKSWSEIGNQLINLLKSGEIIGYHTQDPFSNLWQPLSREFFGSAWVSNLSLGEVRNPQAQIKDVRVAPSSSIPRVIADDPPVREESAKEVCIRTLKQLDCVPSTLKEAANQVHQLVMKSHPHLERAPTTIQNDIREDYKELRKGTS